MKVLYIRVPDQLHAWLVERAKKDRRSLTKQVLHMLETEREEIELWEFGMSKVREMEER